MPALSYEATDGHVFRLFPHSDIFSVTNFSEPYNEPLDIFSNDNTALMMLKPRAISSTESHLITEKCWSVKHFGTYGYQDFRLELAPKDAFSSKTIADLADFVTNDCHGSVGQVLRSLQDLDRNEGETETNPAYKFRR